MRMGRIYFLALVLAFPQLAAAQVFPDLPPSRHCIKDDIAGLWELRQIYEVPEGTEMQEYKRHPFQYTIFRPNDTYETYIAPHRQRPAVVLKEIAGKKDPTLLQYVVDKSGFLFLYKNGVAADTQACFIVANRSQGFEVGQLLLMPPEGKIKGRLVWVYSKIWSPPK